MNLRCYMVIALLVSCSSIQAQPVSSLIQKAEKEAKAGQFMAAAELWERAGRIKNADPDLLYLAAEAYNRCRDYLRAGDCYRSALNAPKYPLAPLRYARAIKQQGRYEAAAIAFEQFIQNYSGPQRAVLVTVADNEIAGCNLYAALVQNQDTNLTIRALDAALNTPENQYAPLPFSDQLLYYSQSDTEKARLMRYLQKDGEWKMPEEAGSLPESVAVRFRSGSFSPDGSRFYYAQCADACPAASGGSVSAAPCTLFCLRKTEDGWSAPERLRPYINLEGSTAMFPQISQAAGTEYLFFSSDRVGGFGGLDLYVCERSLEADVLDFSFPQNLGGSVNTGADEVTPFFQADTKTLWFSTLGRPSIGGLDIFKTELDQGVWSKPLNLGLPYNSSADDCFFVLKRSGLGAYLVSNRGVSETKSSTTDDDIFELRW